MLKAVVFDMDETLLQINLSAFIAVLARDESSLLAQIGRRDPFTVFAAYLRGMLDLQAGGRDGARTNLQIFDEGIERRCGVMLSDPVIADVLTYYEREVLPGRNDRVIQAGPMPGGIEAVEACLDRGLAVGLFTNPSFSKACIECRMRWAGIDALPFSHVTYMENSHHCKPDAAYYREALAAMGAAPEETLMVGNDSKRDFPKPDIGLATAYVGSGRPARAIWCGRMGDFAAQLDDIAAGFAGQTA